MVTLLKYFLDQHCDSTHVAIVSVQQRRGGVRRGVGHHVFARVVERRQVPGVNFGVVCASRLPTDAVQQFRFGVFLSVTPSVIDPQRLLAARAQHAQLRQVATDNWHYNDIFK